MSTSEYDDPTDPPRSDALTLRYDDFGEPIKFEIAAAEPRLQAWHTVNARSYMLAGNPLDALRALDRPFGEPTTTDELRVVLRAHHLVAEAHLELRGRRNPAAAIEHALLGFNLACLSNLGQERIYGDALFITWAEALRRNKDLGKSPEVIPALRELMDQLSQEEDARFKALQYAGFRTLALAIQNKAERSSLQKLALQHRDEYLQEAHTLLGDLSFIGDEHDHRLNQPGRSALLTLLIDFPFPSQGPTELPSSRS